MITIVDYGAGNLASIRNMLAREGIDSRIASRPDEVLSAEKLVLPGVGAFDHAMDRLRTSGFAEALTRRVVGEGVAILGICLGAQLFLERSEEGSLPGLGWIEGDVRRFQPTATSPKLKVPHMGWAGVTTRKSSMLFDGMSADSRFYFVHSYFMACRREDDVAAVSTHGESFVSAIERGNIFGVQFHPEKSHKFGMGLLKRFATAA